LLHVAAIPQRHIFSFRDRADTALYTLSLHDALPIWRSLPPGVEIVPRRGGSTRRQLVGGPVPLDQLEADAQRLQAGPGASFELVDRKSTRLNSSHVSISYAVFCLKKKRANRHSHVSI